MSVSGMSDIREKGLESRQLQRRIRHLQFIIGRNIDSLKPVTSKVKEKATDFSLSYSLHTSSKPCQVLYESESLLNSVNPNWKEFDPKLFCDQTSCTATSCIVCVWASRNGKSKLMLKWNVDFSGLCYVGDQQKPLDSQKLDPNTLIFGMFGGYYTSPRKQFAENDEGARSEILGTLLKVDQSSVRWTYQKNSLMRVHYMLKALYETKQQVTNIQTAMRRKTNEKEILSTKYSEKECLTSRIEMLREELNIQRGTLLSAKKCLLAQSQTVKERGRDLSERHESLEQHVTGLKAFHSAHIERREALLKIKAQLDFRRKQLVGELSYIYPILELPTREYTKREYGISGVLLPNSDDFIGKDEETLAVALGNTCHLVHMMAKFLELPLRYSIRPMGSRSTMLDLVNDKLSEKLREFPLNPKSKEKFLFHYGLFLLNKNIAQLRYHNGLGTSDLRKTLPNLKHLFESKFGVKVIFKKEHEILPHGYERPSPARKGTSLSLKDSVASSPPHKRIQTREKQVSDNGEVRDTNSNKKIPEDKEASGLKNVKKHSQIHKFMNRRSKRTLAKTYSAPESSSSDNLIEVPFEDLLTKSYQGQRRINSSENPGISEETKDMACVEIIGEMSASPEVVVGSVDQEDKNGDENVELFRTIASLENMSPFEEMEDSRNSYLEEEDDISCIVERHSLSSDQVVLSENDVVGSSYSRQLSDVLVIPDPFEMDHTLQQIQSHLGNRI